jgi:hypothetical protein
MVLGVMLLVPAQRLRANIALKPCEDTVCIQTCKRTGFWVEAVARFMNRLARQIAVLIGIGVFRLQERLTGFGEAGKIIRIRTNTATARDAIC